jgi:hypothetical protein
MDDTQTASDTITMAALMRALQVALHEVGRHDPNALARVERTALQAIKALDPADFDYAEQADGLGEGLRLVRTVFRHARVMQDLRKPPILPDQLPIPE